MGVLQHGRFILQWCGTPFLTKRWIHNRLEIENRLVLGSKIILKNWAKRAAWGMWDIKPALYDNEVKNCLVATYGIQGLAEKHDFFGYLDVYFNYDSEENYQILDLQFKEYDPTATVTDSSTDGDETAENQADSVAGAAASYEQVIDEYRDMVQNHFYMDLQAKDRDGNIVHVFDNYEFGYRTNFDLCSGGLIEVTSSLSAAEYDYHTLLKVAEMAGLAGIIGFHEAGDGYLVTFPQGGNVQALIDDYKGRLRDLENNIWQH